MHWQCANDIFGTMFCYDDDYAPLQGKMLFVWESNHCLTKWSCHFHTKKLEWYVSIDCTYLSPFGFGGVMSM